MPFSPLMRTRPGVLATFSISLLDWDLIRAPQFVGLDNYIKLLTDDVLFRKVLWNTGYYVLGTVPSGVILILPGFKSRWMIPFSCAASNPSAMRLAI